MDHVCANCFYFSDDYEAFCHPAPPRDGDGAFGLCMRQPPIAQGEGRYALWPMVHPAWWCGEFELWEGDIATPQ